MSTKLREVLQCLEKSPTLALSLLKATTTTSAFPNKNLLRHYYTIYSKYNLFHNGTEKIKTLDTGYAKLGFKYFR